MNQTTTSQNNLWNFYRDAASWMMHVAESMEARAHNASLASMQLSRNKDLYQQKFLSNLALQVEQRI